MEPQLQHTQGHHYEEQDDEHHGEKKSMMQKVKEKAKRFKDSMTKHGHQQHDDGDDDDNEDETVEDPKVHDSPNASTQPSGNLERPSVIAKDRYTNKPVASHGPLPTFPARADGTNLSGQSGLGGQQHQGYGQDVNPEEKEEVPFAPNPAKVPTPETEHTYGTKHPFENHGQDGTHGGSESSIGKSTGMMKVPHALSGLGSGSGSGSDPANYETKVTNPTHTEYDSDAKLTQPSGNLERPSAIAEDRHTKPVASHDPPLTVPAGADGTNLSGQSELDGQQHQCYGQEVHPEEKEEVPFAPNPATVPTPETEQTYGTEHPFENRGQDGTHRGLKSSIEKSTGMMKVPHAPSGLGSGSGSDSDPANYETKVTNPTDTDAILTQPSDNLERPSVITEDRYAKPVASHDPSLTVPAGADGTNLSGQAELDGQEDINSEKWRSKIGEPTGIEEEVPFAPNPAAVPTPETEHTYEHPFENHGQDGTHGGLQSSIGKSTGMMKVPHAPSGLGSGSGSDPANYETKVTNPTHTGGKEGLSEMQHSFDKMGIHDSGSERKRFDPEHPESIRRATLAGNQSTQSSSYTEKISSTASAPAEKAAVAKDVIASKLGYSGEHPTTAESHENVKNSGSTATDYAHMITDKVTETLAPVYGKMVDAGSSVMSKVQGTVFGTGTGSGAGTGHQQMHGTENVKGTDKVVSVKEGDEDKAHAIHGGNQEESDKNVTERTE